jgi:hypothetical protein
MGAHPMCSSRGLCIIGSMRPLPHRVISILVSVPLYILNSNTLLSMYFPCNSRKYVITLYSGYVCVVLCVNASVLTSRIDPG